MDVACVSKSSYLEYSPIPSVEEIDEQLAICRGYIERLTDHPDELWLGYGRHTVNLPLDFSPEARARLVELRIELMESVRTMPGHVFPPSPVELQLFRWNDIALLFNPSELFVQLGLEVKRRSPHRYTFPVCYSGGGPGGYVGPAEEVARGGYHFVYYDPGRCAPDTAERIVNEMVELAKG